MEENARKDATAGTPPPLSSLLEGFLNNPDLTKRVGDILRSMPSAANETNEQSTSLPLSSLPDTDGLASVLSDPSLMEKLPQIMTMIKPMLTSMPISSHTQSDASHAAKSHLSDRDRLLLSLKPFLSPERQDAVDSILRIAQLGSLLKQLK